MKKVILKGDERVVDTIIRENRVRVSRGQVSFSPADSVPTPEGVTEEDVKDMVEAIKKKDGRIAELMDENATLRATLADIGDTKDAPETTDTKDGGETDTTHAPEGDTKDVEETPDTKSKKTSKK